jgi:hypothetical protein
LLAPPLFFRSSFRSARKPRYRYYAAAFAAMTTPARKPLTILQSCNRNIPVEGENHSTENKRLYLAPHPQSTEEILAQVFARLGLQVSYLVCRKPEFLLVAERNPKGLSPLSSLSRSLSFHLPTQFNSTQDAIEQMDIISNGCPSHISQRYELNRKSLENRLTKSNRVSLRPPSILAIHILPVLPGIQCF